MDDTLPGVREHVRHCSLCRQHDRAVAGLRPSRVTEEKFRQHTEETYQRLKERRNG